MDAEVVAHVQLWFRDQALAVAARLAQIRRTLTGTADAQPPDILADESTVTLQQAVNASAFDPVIWRAMVRRGNLLNPPDAWRHNEEVLERVRRRTASSACRTFQRGSRHCRPRCDLMTTSLLKRRLETV
jgi:hypothetical protein